MSGSKKILIIFIIAVLVVIFLGAVYTAYQKYTGSDAESKNINEPTITEEVLEEQPNGDSTAEIQACLIALVGADTILKIQSGEMQITPEIQAKMGVCVERYK